MKILFVCSGNSFRSPLAEALLRKLRPDLQVDSAGTQKADHISQVTKTIARANDVENLLKKTPEAIDSKNLRQYDLIVAMESVHKEAILNQCAECHSKVIVWNVGDMVSQQEEYIEKSSRQIIEKTKELAQSLIHTR